MGATRLLLEYPIYPYGHLKLCTNGWEGSIL